MTRRLGVASGGYRTIGYDPNPTGLFGTNPNNRRLTGTTATASDYKNAKQKKQNEEKEKVKLGDKPPYEEDEGIPGHNGIIYFTEFDDDGNKDYKVDKVVLGKGVKDTPGEGWVLKLHFKKSDIEDILGYKLDSDVSGTLTGLEQSWFHIRDVSDKRQVKLPTAPLENGMVKHDHKVVMPKTMRVAGLVGREHSKMINGFLEYAASHKSLEVFFELKSPWKNYKRMYLSGHSSKASNRMYDMYEYTIDLSELLFASNLTDKTSDAELASNKEKGSAKGK
jgi:hypothetical protein